MRIHTLVRDARRYINGWTVVSAIGGAAILLPLAYVLSGLFRQENENWANVKRYLLTDYVLGSLKLVVLTGFFATFVGVLLAWLVALYKFPLSRFFRWALVLPLVVPPYIGAYTYSTMTGYTGIIQATLRNHFDVSLKPGMIEVMSERGAVFILVIFLFPYVYMITRTFLERQSASYVENARLLGRTRASMFFYVVLPVTRPAIIAGGSLVIFEVLSDYGVSSYFGLQTVSTAIFQTWFGMYDVESAIKLAAWLLMVVIGIYMLERYFRRNQRYQSTTSRSKPLRKVQLKGFRGWVATAICSAVFLIGFILPIAQLGIWAAWTYRKIWRYDYGELILNTMTAAVLSTIAIMLIALISAKAGRMSRSVLSTTLSRLMTTGYAVPGTIIAIGILAVFIALDGRLSAVYGWLGYGEGALVLSLSLFMLICGYVIRFITTGYNAIETGFEKIPHSYSEAPRTLGHNAWGTFFCIELPLLKSSVIAGCILTFVEVVKELPLTLLLRPFNYDTLATRTYQYAIDERIFEASIPSLLLIAVSLVSVLVMIKIEKEKII